jgi:hypothetical protein
VDLPGEIGDDPLIAFGVLGQEQSPFQRARDDHLGGQHGGESRVQPGGLSGGDRLDRLGAGIEVTTETPRHLQDPAVIVSGDAVEGHRDVLFLRVARPRCSRRSASSVSGRSGRSRGSRAGSGIPGPWWRERW